MAFSRTAEMEEKYQGHLTCTSTIKNTPIWTMTGRPKTVPAGENTPAPGHYGVPDIEAKSTSRRTQRILILQGPRGGPNMFRGGSAPDPTAYDCKLHDINPGGKITSKAARTMPLKRDDEPGPGEYPPRPTWNGQDGKCISFAGRSKEGTKSSPEIAYLAYTPEDKHRWTSQPQWKLNHTSQRSKLATSDTPGPGSYKPSYDYDSTSRKVLGRSWQLPVSVKKPRGTPKQVSNQGGDLAHYSLFFDKPDKKSATSMSSTA
eukprot:TRINITY_DN34844_c0_g1_i1.p1 TRINITY_DN34844_c0_g1~~TRINITY_DN34844_c0_g1_i1.p1  ORF type:complete len:260 (+),score=4.47 TRINITY_DN34844_c0_g1_i1:135-914(+)